MTILSVIVPAYKQVKTIRIDLLNIENVLKQLRIGYEIICVVDGRVDKTYETAKKVRSKKIKVYCYDENFGKGFAVRFGMAKAKGDLVAFIDSGMDIDPNGISMLLEHMEWYNADIIIGSKRHPASVVDYPLVRRIYSVGYQIIVKILFGLNVRDTQTGLKIYKRKVLEKVLPRMLVKKFAFDIELLAVARYLGFKRIYEAPVKIYNEAFIANSTVEDFKAMFRVSFRTFMDTVAVFYRLYILRYYRDSNYREWKKHK